MILQFTLMFIGTCIGYRIFTFLKKRFLFEQWFDRGDLTKIMPVILIFLLVTVFFSLKMVLLFIFFIAILFFARLFYQKVTLWLENKRFREEFVVVLNEIIVRMSGGNSFRQAFSRSIEGLNERSRKIWQELLEIVTFSQQISSSYDSNFKNQILQEFFQIDRCSQSAVKQLKIFRRRFQMIENFRHKSGAVSRQIRVQSYIMIALYVLLLLFVLFHFDWKRNLGFISISFFLFFVGAAWLLLSGRRLKWKL